MGRETVHVETKGRIATVILERAPSGNRIDQGMANEIRDACDRLGRADDIWLVVVTGAGDNFCLGTEELAREEEIGGLSSLRVSGSIASLEKPVIAALNGDAFDQGLEVALACDIRIASEEARLGLIQLRRGLMPWDGGTQRLPRLVGRGRALEMMLTGRLTDSAEAWRIGLVNEVVPADAVLPRALEIASTIASHGPVAAGYLKEAVRKGLDMTMEQGLRLEADLNLLLHSTADRAEGISSFLERRKPTFRRK